MSLFLRLQMKGFSMGVTTVYISEEIMSVSLDLPDEVESKCHSGSIE